ncbi:hypothetical protein PG985_010378 [Apiospora marii]|uniref:Uncharacterized protein n=1 Tax=Apiospora marii TaxID=335849 RepID=A0ABR1RN51_9PEZI
MTDHNGRPEPPVLRKNGFCLWDQTFGTTSSYPRVEGSRLRELFNSERLRYKTDQKSTVEEAKSLFRKDFFISQLRWYGVPFKSTSSSMDLKQMLRTAVENGKCTHIPESVLALEQSMRADRKYAEKLRAWRNELEEWNAEEKRKEEQKWEACLTPGEQANHNLDKFLSLYFLDDQGEPDPTKTTEPMALHGFANRSQLHKKAKSIAGLETHSGGEDSSRTICIGWDREAVWALASRLDDESRVERENELADKWDKAMKEHNRLAALVKRDGPKTNPRSKQPARMQKCKGSYLVECEAAAEEWPSRHLFTLDVSNGPDHPKTGPFIVMGWLSLTHFEGTMLLSLDQHKLDNYVKYGQDEVPEDSSEDSENSDSEDVTEKQERMAKNTIAQGKKRKAASAGAKRGPPAKKERSPHRRIHLRLRGYETYDAMILHEPRVGYIEFTDDDFTHFKGVADIPDMGEEVAFEGFKVSHVAKEQPEPWENFSKAAYEREEKERWG